MFFFPFGSIWINGRSGSYKNSTMAWPQIVNCDLVFPVPMLETWHSPVKIFYIKLKTQPVSRLGLAVNGLAGMEWHPERRQV